MFPNLAHDTLGIKTDLAGAVELAARSGWPGCELPIIQATRLSAERSADDVAAIFARAGVRLGGWGLPINWREPYDQAALAALREQAAVAEQLGCTRARTWVMPGSNDRPFRDNWAYHVAQLRPVAQVLAEHGCRLALEFVGPRTLRASHRYGFVYSLDAMLSLAEAVGPNAGLLLDCYHWYTSAGAPADIRGLRADDVVYVHVNDAPADTPLDEQLDQVRCLPGATGVIDIAGFLQALREIGYEGPVTPEPFDQSLAALTPDEASAKARDSMRAIWRAAGLE